MPAIETATIATSESGSPACGTGGCTAVHRDNPTHITPEFFFGEACDTETGLDYFGARYNSSTLGRFLTPDPAGAGFSSLSDPQSWNLYSYVENNPINFIDPDGHECVWDDGSFDSQNDPQTGSYTGCTEEGGTWFDPGTFTAGNGQDWSASSNATLAAMVAEDEALRDNPPALPGFDQAVWGSTWTTGTTTAVAYGGTGWQTIQVSTGTHPWRDNNPGDMMIAGGFSGRHGAIGNDSRIAVFPTIDTGSNALDSLLHTPKYMNMTVNGALAAFAPPSENNTAAYQQFIQDAIGVGPNTPVSSLSPSQFMALENGIARYEGFHVRGNYSVTTTLAVTPP